MNECRIIEDLLPLYTDRLLQEDTNEFVKLHLVRCAACSEKEKQLKAKIELPPPDESETRFRRVGKKLRRKKLITACVSIFVTVAIVFAGYTSYYFTREAKLKYYEVKRDVSRWIHDTKISNLGGVEVSEERKEGERAHNGEISVCLPEGVVLKDPGYADCRIEPAESKGTGFSPLAENLWFPTPSEDEIRGITDRIMFIKTGNYEVELEFTRDKDMKKYFDLGKKLVQEQGITRKMELARYYISYDFKSISSSSPEEDLAIGLYLTQFAKHEMIKDTYYSVTEYTYYRPITGRLTGYCFMGEDSEWFFYLEDTKDPESCYYIDVKGDKFLTSYFDYTKVAVLDFLARVEIE